MNFARKDSLYQKERKSSFYEFLEKRSFKKSSHLKGDLSQHRKLVER